MGWGEIITVIGLFVTLISGFVALGAMIISIFNRLDNDIRSIANRMDTQTARTDQLYQMFIDLLKDRRNP
jgi:hypothetical protein